MERFDPQFVSIFVIDSLFVFVFNPTLYLYCIRVCKVYEVLNC